VVISKTVEVGLVQFDNAAVATFALLFQTPTTLQLAGINTCCVVLVVPLDKSARGAPEALLRYVNAIKVALEFDGAGRLLRDELTMRLAI